MLFKFSRRHDADSSEDLRLRVKRKDKLSDKPGSDSDASEGTRLRRGMSRPMGKPTICIGENKDADQLRGSCEADQRLCFCHSDSTIPPLLNSKISSF